MADVSRPVSEADVERAIAEIAARDVERGRDAQHVYDTLTWGEGSSQLSQAVVQDWVWYRLATKYMTDDPDDKRQLADVAAELFDGLGLDRYAAICRSETTARVHDAYDRSNSAGFKAMRVALDSSGIEPVDVAGFSWSTVMGGEEAAAHATAQLALEQAITSGQLRVGGRRWRDTQQAIVAEVLDGDHPTLPTQSLRTTTHTERADAWRRHLVSRSPTIATYVERAINHALTAPTPPPDDEIVAALHPLLWLLEHLGDGQAMTAAGNLNRPFVVDVWATRPWTDELLPLDRPPRSETDDFILHSLRQFTQQAGLTRVTKRMLRRTKLADTIATNPPFAWATIATRLGVDGWNRFVAETAALILTTSPAPVDSRSTLDTIAQAAGELGWRTGGHLPSGDDVAHGFADTRRLLTLFGALAAPTDWQDHSYKLTDLGTNLAATIRHTAATGPRNRP